MKKKNIYLRDLIEGEEYICLACKVSGQVDDTDHLYQLAQRGRCHCSNYKKSKLKKEWVKKESQHDIQRI